MKKLIFSTLFTASLFLSSKASFEKNTITDSVKSSTCLEVLGIAIDEGGKPIDGAEIKLFKENDELEWSEITSVFYHEHSFVFNLDVDGYYTIEITKPGYIKRLIGISTKLPSNVSYEEIFHHEFEVTLLQEKTEISDYYLDFPVAIIKYDPKRDVFDNNYVYTTHIKTKMKETVTIK